MLCPCNLYIFQQNVIVHAYIFFLLILTVFLIEDHARAMVQCIFNNDSVSVPYNLQVQSFYSFKIWDEVIGTFLCYSLSEM